MSVAYCILAHKNPPQLLRLVRALYHAEDIFYIHIDRRAGTKFRAIRNELNQLGGNVHLLKSEPILWAGPRMSEVQIQSMALALSESPGWTHWINLSGQDFPVKSRREIVSTLDKNPDTSYLTWFNPAQSDLWKNAMERVGRYYLNWAWFDRVLRLPLIGRKLRSMAGWNNNRPFIPGICRKWPEDVIYYGGSNFVVLNREACGFLANDSQSVRLRRWLSHSIFCDEIIYQTVLLNSHLKEKCENRNYHKIHFTKHSPNPEILMMKDLDMLLKSDVFFARKFDPEVDLSVIEELERRLALV